MTDPIATSPTVRRLGEVSATALDPDGEEHDGAVEVAQTISRRPGRTNQTGVELRVYADTGPGALLRFSPLAAHTLSTYLAMAAGETDTADDDVPRIY